jgi:hypothetical protein
MMKLYRIKAANAHNVYYVIATQGDEGGIRISLTEEENQSTLFNGDQIEQFVPGLNQNAQNNQDDLIFSSLNTSLHYDPSTGEISHDLG